MSKIFNLLASISTLIMIAIMFSSYIAFMTPDDTLINTTEATYVIHVGVFNVVFMMMLWTFLMARCTPKSLVPPPYKLKQETLNKLREAKTEEEFNEMIINYCLHHRIKLWTRTETGCIRYCEKCRCIKPDRAYHCTLCDVCVLKYSHHSFFFNNCICFANYKLYVVSLFWSSAYTFYFAVISSGRWYDIITLRRVFNDIADSNQNFFLLM